MPNRRRRRKRREETDRLIIFVIGLTAIAWLVLLLAIAEHGFPKASAMETYSQAKAAQVALEAEVKAASKGLKAFCRLDNGLTPDAVKATAEWQEAKARYDRAFAQLRQFNARFTTQFAREIRAERRAK